MRLFVEVKKLITNIIIDSLIEVSLFASQVTLLQKPSLTSWSVNTSGCLMVCISGMIVLSGNTQILSVN